MTNYLRHFWRGWYFHCRLFTCLFVCERYNQRVMGEFSRKLGNGYVKDQKRIGYISKGWAVRDRLIEIRFCVPLDTEWFISETLKLWLYVMVRVMISSSDTEAKVCAPLLHYVQSTRWAINMCLYIFISWWIFTFYVPVETGINTLENGYYLL